ncbi:MAG TPA: DUF721 domain-containing protein [Terriglobales bacterium]|nr:DUF721 domain-containing protein [Terriglobales bacterium]
MRRKSEPQAVVGPLAGVLRGLDRDGAFGLFDVWRVWNASVGESIAKRAQPRNFRNRVVIVTVDSSTWMQELQSMKERLRRELNQRLGAEAIADIVFVAGTIEVASPPPPPVRSAAERALGDSSDLPVPPIEDDEVAAAFDRLLRARSRRAAAVRDGRRRPSKN